ncbi:MAG: esterase family protein [Cyanobacteria bacterium SZAS LIN-3]|nr:esterase family protein [Cyanobacteria bacterium SZAS LIN-3]
MNRQYHKWHSTSLDREMELLVFGHGGARVIVFPTSCGRFYDWENREMIKTLEHHIDQGWLQVFCVDSVDFESWWNTDAHPRDKAARHLAYHKYVIDEVLPFTKKLNDNDFVIALGASMGAYHAANITFRFPESFNRCVAMSGPYDFAQMSGPYNIFSWINDYNDDSITECNPVPFIKAADTKRLDKLKNVELIFPMGATDPLHEGNQLLSEALKDKEVPHAFHTWDGFAHDWPYWQEMVLHYIGGDGTR